MKPVLFGFLFEAPLAALSVAVAGVSIPFVIHLLNRRRYQVVNWAAMRFLLAAQRRKARRMRLEQATLLAVRAAVILALVFAMASVAPWAEAIWLRLFPGRGSVAAAVRHRAHKLIVIDGSFSMAARFAQRSCFERAKDLSMQIVRQSSNADGFSVVLMAAPPCRIVNGPSEDPLRVVEELTSLALPHGNADLGATLAVIGDLLKKSPDKYQEREVYFLTDVQRSSWAAKKTVDGPQLLRAIQEQARVIIVDVGQDIPWNSAITSVRVGVPLVTCGTGTQITATVQHYSKVARQHVRAQLLVGRARSAEADPRFAMALVQQTDVDLQLGQNSVQFVHKFTTPGQYAIQIRLENDAIDLDDSRTAVIDVKKSLPVMVVNGKPAGDPYEGASEWLLDALNPFGPGAAPVNAPARPRVFTEAEFADPVLSDLANYECVYLCDVPRLTAAEAARLDVHLRRGGGLVVFLGPHVDVDAYNRILHRDGQGILPARLMSRKQAPGTSFFNLIADEARFREPPLSAFVSEQDRAGLFSVRFHEYVRAQPAAWARTVLSLVPEIRAGEARNKGQLGRSGVARAGTPSTVDQDPALVHGVRHRGQVVLFTSTANRDWTTWPVSPTFPAMMQEVLYLAASGRTGERATNVGETVEVPLDVAAPSLPIHVRLPDGRTRETAAESIDGAGMLRWDQTDSSGLYVATVGSDPHEYLFAINVPTATDSQQGSESDPDRVALEELQTFFPDVEFQLVTDPGQVRHTTRTPTETPGDRPNVGVGLLIARWSLRAMFLLLFGEMLLAWLFGRYGRVISNTDDLPSGGRLLVVLAVVAGGLAIAVIAGILAHALWTGDLLGFLPDSARLSVERQLGIPPPTAGEATRWHLQFNALVATEWHPWWAMGLALGLGILIAWVYFHEGSVAGNWYKLVLIGLRCFLVLLAIVVLLPQVQICFEREAGSDVAILIDDSQSMGATDRYRDDNSRAKIGELDQEAPYADPQRLYLVQRLLTEQNGVWLRNLITSHRVRVRIYRCSTNAARVAELNDPQNVKEAVEAIRTLRPVGGSSRLGLGLRQVLDEYRGSPLAAVIVMTDGITTEGENLLTASYYAARSGIPVFFFGVGDARETRELRLHDLDTADAVDVNDRLVFEARLTAHGFHEARAVTATLSEKEADGRLKTLVSEPVTIDPDGKPVRFRLVHQPSQPGEKRYVLNLPLSEEDTDGIETNRLERTVLVRDRKLIRVLYIEGYPRYEYRFVKNLLERENGAGRSGKSIDLRVLLIEADAAYPSEDKSALSEFPTREELDAYDVVLLGDVDPKDRRIGERTLAGLAKFVKDRGKGFLMIAGSRFSPRAYGDTALASVLPIRVDRESSEADAGSPYRPELTGVGRFHPIFRLDPDESQNTELWKRLAPMYWWSRAYGLQPAAEVLLVHPGQPARLAGQSGEAGAPLAVQQFVGSGRSMFYGFDETWRWRLRHDETRFNQFWIQTIRYLAGSGSGSIQLRVDRQTYRRGEPLKVSVRFPDDKPPPGPDTRVEVVGVRSPLNQPGRGAEVEKMTIRLGWLEGSRATYEGILNRAPEGEYRFTLSVPAVSEPRPHAEARVLAPPGEMDQLRINRAEMEEAAAATKGRFYTLAEVDELAQNIPSGSHRSHYAPQPPRQIWNHSIVFLVAVGLLATEWVLRKKRHLL
jgi:hypothetical protein